MIPSNPFVVDSSQYTREVDIKRSYINGTALVIHRKHPQYSLEYCIDYVKKSMEKGQFNEFKDPRVAYVEQVSRGNRKLQQDTFLNYLNMIVDSNYMLSPSLIAYLPPTITKSQIAEFQIDNTILRGQYKKKMFTYAQEGNKAMSGFYNNMQSKAKENNNSVSGANVSKFNPLYNKSAHTTLTSACRSATSYANATNERLIAGNRHYYHPNVVLQELTNVMQFAPLEEMDRAIKQYGLRYPSTDEVMTCILKSSRKYWNNKHSEDFIRQTVEGMHDVEKAAFCYGGDLYHLDLFNDNFVCKLITEFTECTDTSDGYYLETNLLKQIDGDKVVTLSLMHSDILKGVKWGELEEKYPDFYKQINTAAFNFENLLIKHSGLISAFLRARYLIPAIAKFKSVRREAVLTSDTDSTIFTTQYWTNRVTGKYDFSKQSHMVAYVVIYICSQVVSNTLAILCANMGVPVDLIKKLQMKNEYYFPIYGLTDISKHYFALRAAQEGIVKEPELEIKGVHLISSKASEELINSTHNYIEHTVLGNLIQDKRLSWTEYLDPVIEEELKIKKSILAGEVTYYTREQIKDPSSYKNGEETSQFFQYLFWKEIFSAKYGASEEPPYHAVKVPVLLEKKKDISNWLDGIASTDSRMAKKIEQFLDKHSKKGLTSILVPLAIAEQNGIPEEILRVVDVNRTIAQLMNPYYITLKTLGVYVGNDKNTRLLSDTYTLPEAA